MQTANCLIALGGDINNTVPKFKVPVSELALLQAIHGEDAVLDLEYAGNVEVSNRDELERLRANYQQASNNEGKRIVDLVYPGRGARVLTKIDELNLVAEQFKAKSRVEAPEEVEEAKPKRARAAKAAKPAAEEDAEEAADNVFED